MFPFDLRFLNVWPCPILNRTPSGLVHHNRYCSFHLFEFGLFKDCLFRFFYMNQPSAEFQLFDSFHISIFSDLTRSRNIRIRPIFVQLYLNHFYKYSSKQIIS
ncbi:hypothetical protein BLOT_005968 [Blomia tropicalis]|nr:hypothetical protein BLOT_005968 [Blomia tropicalis]